MIIHATLSLTHCMDSFAASRPVGKEFQSRNGVALCISRWESQFRYVSRRTQRMPCSITRTTVQFWFGFGLYVLVPVDSVITHKCNSTTSSSITRAQTNKHTQTQVNRPLSITSWADPSKRVESPPRTIVSLLLHRVQRTRTKMVQL